MPWWTCWQTMTIGSPRKRPAATSAKAQKTRADVAPFGTYLETLLGKEHSAIMDKLHQQHKLLQNATSVAEAANVVVDVSALMDQEMAEIRTALHNGKGKESVTKFSTLRGNLLEEVALTIARLTVKKYSDDIVVRKFSTGDGVITGLAFRYSRGKIPNPTDVMFRRDREDVIVGFPRSVRLIDSSTSQELTIPDQIVPFCIIACKIYIDATRLENVLAKARSILPSYAGASFFVLSEWDALGSEWHGESGHILDALYAPVDRLIFLREGSRPKNEELQERSLQFPYRRKLILALADGIEQAYKAWVGDASS